MAINAFIVKKISNTRLPRQWFFAQTGDDRILSTLDNPSLSRNVKLGFLFFPPLSLSPTPWTRAHRNLITVLNVNVSEANRMMNLSLENLLLCVCQLYFPAAEGLIYRSQLITNQSLSGCIGWSRAWVTSGFLLGSSSEAPSQGNGQRTGSKWCISHCTTLSQPDLPPIDIWPWPKRGSHWRMWTIYPLYPTSRLSEWL